MNDGDTEVVSVQNRLEFLNIIFDVTVNYCSNKVSDKMFLVSEC